MKASFISMYKIVKFFEYCNKLCNIHETFQTSVKRVYSKLKKSTDPANIPKDSHGIQTTKQWNGKIHSNLVLYSDGPQSTELQ